MTADHRMSAYTDSSAWLRSRLRGTRKPLLVFGAMNAIAASVADSFGADGLWVSGLEVSAAMGLPDENVLGPRDLTDVMTWLRRVSNLPVIVDVDNAGNCTPTIARLARDLWTVGATAICLEDSAGPKRNSFRTDVDQRLTDVHVMLRQIETVRRLCPELVVIARTEALIAGCDLRIAIDRAGKYAESGADAVVVHSSGHAG